MLSRNAVKNAVRKNDYSIQKNADIMQTFTTVILANKYRIIPIVSGCYAVRKMLYRSSEGLGDESVHALDGLLMLLSGQLGVDLEGGHHV